MINILHDNEASKMIQKTKKTKSAVTASDGFVQLNSTLTEEFSYTKLKKISFALTKPVIMVSFQFLTVVWDIFSPNEHVCYFEFDSTDISCSAVAEDLGIFVFGSEFGIVSVFLGPDGAVVKNLEESDQNEDSSQDNSDQINDLNLNDLQFNSHDSHRAPIATNTKFSTSHKISDLFITSLPTKNSYRIISLAENGHIEIYLFDKKTYNLSKFNERSLFSSQSSQNNSNNNCHVICTSRSRNFLFVAASDNKIYQISSSGTIIKKINVEHSSFYRQAIKSIRANVYGDRLLVVYNDNQIQLISIENTNNKTKTDDEFPETPENPHETPNCTVLFQKTFDAKFKIKKGCYFPNPNCFVIAVMEKAVNQYFMLTFDIRDESCLKTLTEIKKDKMRYKIADVQVLFSGSSELLNFMCVATERVSKDVPLKSVLKIHRMIPKFC